MAVARNNTKASVSDPLADLPPRSNPNGSKKRHSVSNAQHVVCHHVFYISQTILELQGEKTFVRVNRQCMRARTRGLVCGSLLQVSLRLLLSSCLLMIPCDFMMPTNRGQPIPSFYPAATASHVVIVH